MSEAVGEPGPSRSDSFNLLYIMEGVKYYSSGASTPSEQINQELPGRSKSTSQSEDLVDLPPATEPKRGKRNLSGAEKRKRAKRTAIAAGRPVKPRKKRSHRRRHRNQAVVEERIPNRSHFIRPEELEDIVWDRTPSIGSLASDGEIYRRCIIDMVMVVVPSEFPKERLTDGQSRMIQRAVLDQIYNCDLGTAPQFRTSYNEKGIIFFCCANESTKRWLINIIPEIHLQDGITLRVGQAKDIVNATRVLVWIPTHLITTPNVDRIYRLLESQNAGLSTEEWRIVTSRPDSLGVTLEIYIDDESARVLHRLRLQPYFGLTQIRFSVLQREMYF